MCKLLKFGIILSLPLLFTFCAKISEDRIEGSWKRINVGDLKDTLFEEYWVFNEQQVAVVRNYKKPASLVDTVCKLNYEIMHKKRKRWVKFETEAPIFVFNPNVTWQLLRLSPGVLVMLNDSEDGVKKTGIYYTEFTR